MEVTSIIISCIAILISIVSIIYTRKSANTSAEALKQDKQDIKIDPVVKIHSTKPDIISKLFITVSNIGKRDTSIESIILVCDNKEYDIPIKLASQNRKPLDTLLLPHGQSQKLYVDTLELGRLTSEDKNNIQKVFTTSQALKSKICVKDIEKLSYTADIHK